MRCRSGGAGAALTGGLRGRPGHAGRGGYRGAAPCRRNGAERAYPARAGTQGRPMSDAELDAKVRELIAYGAPFVDADGLIAAVRGIEDETDPTRLLRLIVPA